MCVYQIHIIFDQLQNKHITSAWFGIIKEIISINIWLQPHILRKYLFYNELIIVILDLLITDLAQLSEDSMKDSKKINPCCFRNGSNVGNLNYKWEQGDSGSYYKAKKMLWRPLPGYTFNHKQYNIVTQPLVKWLTMLKRRWPNYKNRPIKHIFGSGLNTETKNAMPKELYGGNLVVMIRRM